jgi:hypothetical protein
MDQHQTYTTLDGRSLDISALTAEQLAFLERCLESNRRGRTAKHFHQLANMVTARENPLLGDTGGRVTQAVWDHPLYQAVRDLEDRLGIRTGDLEAMPGDQAERDPLEDEWVGSADAAETKGVTLAALHKAIGRGELVARTAKPGGSRVVVSARSLERWFPNPVRQAAGRSARPTPRIVRRPDALAAG